MKIKKRKELGAVIVIIIITALVMILSFVLSKIGYEGSKTIIVNNSLETTIVQVKNIFSLEGIRFIIGNFASNIKIFEPLFLLITTLISASIIESSGVLKKISRKTRKIKSVFITFFVVLVSIISVFFGEYSYLLLMPLVAIFYKEMGKSPILGILTVFLGVTIGYGSGVFANYHDYVMGGMTELAAKIDVDKNYKFYINSYDYIKILSTLIIAIFSTHLIEKKLSKKLPKPIQEEELVEYNVRKGLIASGLVMLSFIILTVLLILPNSFGAKYMLNIGEDNYTAMLFSSGSPFREGIFLFILLGVSLSSYVYGSVTKKFKNTQDFSSGFSTYFDNMGIVFVLIFFVSQLISILNWTNISNVISFNLISLMSKAEFSGIPLIITLFIVTILIGLFKTSTIEKWEIMSPLTIPLFMRSNITPEFTQFIFKAADGVSKTLTPLFPYYIIMLGFIKKYNNDKPMSLFGAMRLMFPIIMFSALIWLLIILSFYIIGVPIGPKGISTL